MVIKAFWLFLLHESPFLHLLHNIVIPFLYFDSRQKPHNLYVALTIWCRFSSIGYGPLKQIDVLALFLNRSNTALALSDTFWTCFFGLRWWEIITLKSFSESLASRHHRTCLENLSRCFLFLNTTKSWFHSDLFTAISLASRAFSPDCRICDEIRLRYVVVGAPIRRDDLILDS